MMKVKSAVSYVSLVCVSLAAVTWLTWPGLLSSERATRPVGVVKRTDASSQSTALRDCRVYMCVLELSHQLGGDH